MMLMYKLTRQAVHCLCLLVILGITACVEAEQTTHVVSPGAYKVAIADVKASPFDSRNMLGTHSLWWGHQADLWEPGTMNNYPVVNSFFRSAKGIIRYGGGANEIPWKACSGPVGTRVAVKAVDWADPMVCAFGVPEYLATVRETGGSAAWLIANIAGINYQMFSMEEMVTQVGEAASALQTAGDGLQRYWELGNELERGRYRWSAEMIASRASAAGREIIRRDAKARLVLPLIEYDDPNQPPRKIFNETLLRAMTQSVNGLALHLYYDGAPGGPTIPTQLATVADTAALYRRVTGQAGAIWITEHGRWPEMDAGSTDWKASWYKTNDMGGVLGTADFLIGLTQIEDVAGAMLHGLRAGPWNVFDKTLLGPEPSGVGKLLLLLGQTTPGKRLQSRSFSQNQSNYKGGYDMRAAAFESFDRQTITVWIINRVDASIGVSVVLPVSAANAVFTAGSSLICPVSDGRCTGSQYRLFPVNEGQVTRYANNPYITLPARSVTSLTFGLKK
jgi:alpha-L-arabinofuranosidase